MKKILLSLTAAVVIVACNSNNKNPETAENGKESITPVVNSDSNQFASNPENKTELGKNDNASSTSVAKVDTGKLTTILWLDSTYRDMGNVKKGDVVEIRFRFRNTGNKPLVISDVTAGCGCTIPEKPKEPYAPGKEGVIRAKFDSQNQQPGEHTKYVTATSNTSPNAIQQLNFRVFVVEKK